MPESAPTLETPPPLPVLVGDTTAELLRVAGFPLYLRPTVVTVSAFLLLQMGVFATLFIFTFSNLFSNGFQHDIRLLISPLTEFFLAVFSFVGGCYLIMTAMIYGRMRQTVSECRPMSADQTTLNRDRAAFPLNARLFPFWFRQGVLGAGVGLILSSFILAFCLIWIGMEELAGGKYPSGEGIFLLSVTALFLSVSLTGGIILLRTGRALRKMERRAKEES